MNNQQGPTTYMELCSVLCASLDRRGVAGENAPAAATKSRQLCLTLCNPIDGSPPSSSVHRILQARILEWVTISFSRRALLQFRAEKLASTRLVTSGH